MDFSMFGSDDRELLTEEAASDPAFARRLEITLALPDGVRRVEMSAQRAILNELDPSLYPETRGTWRKLRAAVSDTVNSAGDLLKIPGFNQAVRKKAVSTLHGLGNLGQDIIGPILNALTAGIQAGTSIYINRQQTNLARDMQQAQIDAQMAQLQLQINIKNAQSAVANAQAAQTGAPGQVATAASDIATNVASAASNMIDTISQPVVGGIPLWAVLLAVFFFAEKA